MSNTVCTAVSMEIPFEINTMTRVKKIFTQEIFTGQVVTAHAVCGLVPVTPNLNSGFTGFLPVHGVSQLTKLKAYMKHRVPIKSLQSLVWS